MALASTTAAYTLINMASKFQEFFYGASGDVTFEYMNEDGEKLSTAVPNVAKVKADLEASAVTDEEMSDKLEEYYNKVGVNDIRDAIMDNFDGYYNKSDVDGKVKVVADAVVATDKTVADNKTAAATALTEVKEVLHGEVVDVDNTTVMSKAQFEANAVARREQYAGSGFVNFGKAYADYVSWGAKINEGMSSILTISTWSSNHFYLGNTREGVVGIPSLNINGTNIKLSNISNADGVSTDYINPDLLNNIYLPQATRNNSVPVITDSTVMPEMKQGDMAILKDLDRNIQDAIGYTDEGSGYTINSTTSFKNDSGGRNASIVYFASLVPNIEYILTFNKSNDGVANVYMYDGVYHNLKTIVDGLNTVTVEVNQNTKYLTIGIGQVDDGVEITDISIKQVSETPIVALQDTTTDDLYTQISNFEIRDSVSRQDLVFLELIYTQHAA